ncbi:SH3 domain-containing protein [Campylobacter sp. MIT 99-7217]|uniref:SH3 domain-containing protein n=1 Tax=Campylobacter sp. MIT 99-7217 TaxID=535091 RepID=UPI0021AED781|nr:SH3 domain-containing protein [Campylobacter sp. MIT 99-7217]
MIKKILLITMLIVQAFSIELDDKEKEIYNNILPSDELGNYEENNIDPYIASNSLVLNASDYKGQYFIGEVFSINLQAITNENTLFDFKLEFSKSNDLEFLNPKVKWQKDGNTYQTTLYFQAHSANANLSQIIVSLTRNNDIFQSSILNLNPIEFKRVDVDKNYSQIVAKNLEVSLFKTNYFDDKNLVMIIHLKAQNANLKYFKLKDPQILQQRVDNIQGDFNASSAYYSAVFEPSKQNIEFSYFNTQTQKLENINLKVEISDDDEISTQTDLNPKNNDLNFYKQIALWVLAGICALVFVLRKNYYFFVAALIFFILSFLVDTTTHKQTLKANTKAKLLPTSQSTSFYISDKEEEVQVLNTRQDYVKILLEDGKIGWVHKDDLLKN